MNQNKSFESLQNKEMQIRNYSPCTIDTYCKLLCNFEKELEKSLYEITTEDFKTRLHLNEEGNQEENNNQQDFKTRLHLNSSENNVQCTCCRTDK